jgi:hypothetical protein
MKKSMIMMSIAALLGLYIPATASQNLPPVKQEVRVVTQEEFANLEKENAITPSEVAPVNNENGNEAVDKNSMHGGGYVVISGAGLLLLIILLIILL